MSNTDLSKYHPATVQAYGREWTEMMYAADKETDQQIHELFEVRITDEDTVGFPPTAKGIEKWSETAKFPIKDGTDAWYGKKQSWPMVSNHLKKWAAYVQEDKKWERPVTIRAASDWWTHHCTTEMVRVACLIFQPRGWTQWTNKEEAVTCLVAACVGAVPFQVLRFAYEGIGTSNTKFAQKFQVKDMSEACPVSPSAGPTEQQMPPPEVPTLTPTKASRVQQVAMSMQISPGNASPGSTRKAPESSTPASSTDQAAVAMAGVHTMMSYFQGEIETKKKAAEAKDLCTSKYEKYLAKLVERVRSNKFVDPRLLSPLALQEAEEKMSGMQVVKSQAAYFGGVKVKRYEAEEDTEYRERGGATAGYMSGLDKMIFILATAPEKSVQLLAVDRMAWKEAVVSTKDVSLDRMCAYCTKFMLKYQSSESMCGDGGGWAAKKDTDITLMMAFLVPTPSEHGKGHGGYGENTRERGGMKRKHQPSDRVEPQQDRFETRGRGKGAKGQKGGGKGAGKGGNGKGYVRPTPGSQGPCKSRLDPAAVCKYGSECKYKHLCGCCNEQHAAKDCGVWDQAKANLVAKQYGMPQVL